MMTADQVRGRMLRLATAPARPRCVTVLHGDIVGSTRLAEAAGADYPRLLVRHRRLIAAAVRRMGGRFLAHAGDGSMALFDRTADAVVAAVDAQRALAAEAWPAGRPVRVRMGIHRGEVHEIDGEPVGVAIHHGARVMAAAGAGQVLLSDAAAADVAADLAAGRPTDLTSGGPIDLRTDRAPHRAAGIRVGRTVDLSTGAETDLTADRAAHRAATLVSGRPIDLTADREPHRADGVRVGQSADRSPGGLGSRARRVVLAEAGWHALRDHDGPVRLHQVVAHGLTVVLPRGGNARRRPAVVALEQPAC